MNPVSFFLSLKLQQVKKNNDTMYWKRSSSLQFSAHSSMTKEPLYYFIVVAMQQCVTEKSWVTFYWERVS